MNALLALFLTLSSLYAQHNKSFIVEGPSMEPTLHSQDRMNVDPAYYRDHDVQRGDIIIFQATKQKIYVKRVIAFPGETVKVQGDAVYINGKRLNEPYLQAAVEAAYRKGGPYNTRNFKEQTVPPGTLFILGDNRSNSSDSRDIGFIKLEQILGKAVKINRTGKAESSE
ncbi:signal peptidase I [Paenibacillus filicis]|uniref:Signal peptidase I n=1 Tax=Paenibacillus gyeongsangnamensis TaxID=3388067 RepID=A0ABT4Q6L9_9BACL|nr:signal peptidase I [Paenibacillus filicis]MCZ8512476.1 signal peptidase I [Paenibacillus filicis]